jgi:hypothetical protein
MPETTEHRSWRGMIERCENPKHIGFKYYGGRGIKVCARWRLSFKDFIADMGPKPTPAHTIDRWPNLDGDYEPGNCRWATPREQRLNQRPYDEADRVLRSWQGGRRSRKAKGRIDLTGQQFGRLTVLRFAETKKKRAWWECACACGTEKIIEGKSLRLGHTQSCGCLNREKTGARAIARNATDNPAKYRWSQRIPD